MLPSPLAPLQPGTQDTNSVDATSAAIADGGANAKQLTNTYIEKAEQAMANVETDPHKAAEELYRVKAEYVQARFGVNISTGA